MNWKVIKKVLSADRLKKAWRDQDHCPLCYSTGVVGSIYSGSYVKDMKPSLRAGIMERLRFKRYQAEAPEGAQEMKCPRCCGTGKCPLNHLIRRFLAVVWESLVAWHKPCRYGACDVREVVYLEKNRMKGVEASRINAETYPYHGL